MSLKIFSALIFTLVVIGILTLIAFFVPWTNVNWGKIQITPGQTVTVTGQAKTQQKNEVASFSAGVEAVNDDKQVAIDEVNQKIESIIDAVKKFGVSDEDIKTQSLSIYQQQDMVYQGDRQVTQPGQWRVNNSVEIKLKDGTKAQEMANLLAQSGATNVYGPNFTIEETNGAQKDLLKDAIGDAREKAEEIASSTGRKLGKVLSVSESGTTQGIYAFERFGAGGGGGAPLEPGSSTVQTSVTVTFELK